MLFNIRTKHISAKERQRTAEGDDPMLPDSGEAQKFLEVGEPLMEHIDLVRGTLTGEADKIQANNNGKYKYKTSCSQWKVAF